MNWARKNIPCGKYKKRLAASSHLLSTKSLNLANSDFVLPFLELLHRHVRFTEIWLRGVSIYRFLPLENFDSSKNLTMIP